MTCFPRLGRSDLTAIIVVTMERIQLPEGYEPSESEEYMNKMQLEYFYRRLEEWKEALCSDSIELVHNLHDVKLNDPDLSDRVSEENQANFELRKGSRCMKLLKKVEDAMRRIENGEYGYCIETGECIGIARLKARPVATLSLEAQQKREKEEGRKKELRRV
jgi:DnaK suppressor protein